LELLYIYIYIHTHTHTHIYMYIYIYHKQKCQVFFFFLLQNWRTGGWNRSCPGGVATSVGGVGGKGSRRVNMVQKMCTHVCKCKNDTC
jgi:hypothetical protein